MDNTQNTNEEINVNETVSTNEESVTTEKLSSNAENLKTAINKKQSIIIGVVAAAVILLIVIIVKFAGVTTLKCDELCEVSFDGLDGKGTASAYFGMEDLNDLAESKDGLNMNIISLESSIKTEVEPSEGLSNGDEVTVTVTYRESLAKKCKVKFKKTTFKTKVEGLPVPEDVNPFENLKVDFSGISPNGKVSFDSGACHDYVRRHVSFNYDSSLPVKNGETIIVKADYSESDAERNLVNITNTEQEYTVSGLSEYLSDTKGIDLSLLEQTISDKVLAVISRAKVRDSFWGEVSFSGTRFHVSESFNYQDLKVTGRYIMSKKEGQYTSANNCISTGYEISLKDSDGQLTKIYFSVEADDVIKQPDGSLSWDNDLDVHVYTDAVRLTTEKNSRKDKYDIVDVDTKTVLIPQF